MDTYAIRKAKGALGGDAKVPASEDTWEEVKKLVAVETPQEEVDAQKAQCEAIKNASKKLKPPKAKTIKDGGRARPRLSGS